MPAYYREGARFSREMLDAAFDIGLETTRPHLDPLIQRVTMGDGEGNEQKYILTGNESQPHELYTDEVEHFDKIGDYVFTLRPSTHGVGLQARDEDLSDARIPVVRQKAANLGRKASAYIESLLVTNVIEDATTGRESQFDAVPLFSTAHNWGPTTPVSPSTPAPTYTTNQSNIYAANRSSDYAATTTIYDDFFGAIVQMNGFRDDKGQKLHQEEGQYTILFNNQSASLWRYLRLAFVEQSLPGDDTNRDGLKLGITLLPCPHLTSTGGSTDQDWYIFKVNAPGKPIVLQERQGFQSETWRDPMKRTSYWQGTLRFGYGPGAWWNCIKVNNA